MPHSSLGGVVFLRFECGQVAHICRSWRPEWAALSEQGINQTASDFLTVAPSLAECVFRNLGALRTLITKSSGNPVCSSISGMVKRVWKSSLTRCSWSKVGHIDESPVAVLSARSISSIRQLWRNLLAHVFPFCNRQQEIPGACFINVL